jgi:hypothetical protein
MGFQHGQAKVKYPDGGSYEGGFFRSEWQGRGVYRFANGKMFDGEFMNGFPLRGMAIDNDGKVYLADFDGKTSLGDAFVDKRGWTQQARPHFHVGRVFDITAADGHEEEISPSFSDRWFHTTKSLHGLLTNIPGNHRIYPSESMARDFKSWQQRRLKSLGTSLQV